MKVGNEDKKKLILAGVLGFPALFAAYYLYSLLFGGPSTPPPPQPVVVTAVSTNRSASPKVVSTGPTGVRVGGAAQKVGSLSGQLDPTLHMEAMRVTESLVYSGTGRNIFAAGPTESAAPVKIAQAIAPPRPAAPPPGPVVPQGPPPPPPINLKFFGTATTPNGNRRAFLVNGDDVFVASIGDVVQRRYRVVSIAANSILVEDIPNSNKQTLPLMGN